MASSQTMRGDLPPNSRFTQTVDGAAILECMYLMEVNFYSFSTVAIVNIEKNLVFRNSNVHFSRTSNIKEI